MHRNTELERFKHLLNTPDGEALMTELETIWDGFNLIGDQPQTTAYNCGLRDAYKFLQQMQQGAFVQDGD